MSVVYFIREQDSGRIKIGVSTDWAARLRKMQTECPGKLSLLGIMAGERAAECEAHDRFRHLRVRGEWFQSAPELLAFITANAAVPLPTSRRPLTSPKLLPVVRKAADLVGGVTALSRLLKISHVAIYKWKQVPPDRCIDIERVTEGQVTRHECRPDLSEKWGKDAA